MKTVLLANTISLLGVISLSMFYKAIWLGLLFFFSGDVPCQWEKMSCKSSIKLFISQMVRLRNLESSQIPTFLKSGVWLKDRTSKLEERRTGEKLMELLCLFPYSVNKYTPYHYGLKRINGHIRDKKYLEYMDKERSGEWSNQGRLCDLYFPSLLISLILWWSEDNFCIPLMSKVLSIKSRLIQCKVQNRSMKGRRGINCERRY